MPAKHFNLILLSIFKELKPCENHGFIQNSFFIILMLFLYFRVLFLYFISLKCSIVIKLLIVYFESRWIRQFQLDELLSSLNCSRCWMMMLRFHFFQYAFHFYSVPIFSVFIMILIKTSTWGSLMIDYCLVYTLIFH